MTSIAEKVMKQEAMDGEIGKHYKTKINMEAEIEKLLRPMSTYLLMTYALRSRMTAENAYGDFKGVLTLHNDTTEDDTHHFIIFDKDRHHDLANFYFHYEPDKSTVYVTSGNVATLTLSTDDVIDVLKATIGIDD